MLLLATFEELTTFVAPLLYYFLHPMVEVTLNVQWISAVDWNHLHSLTSETQIHPGFQDYWGGTHLWLQ